MKVELVAQIIMWIGGILGVGIIGLLVYIWKSYTNRQDKKDEKQEAFNDVIIESFASLNTTIKNHGELHKVHFKNHDKLSEKVDELRKS